MNIFISFLKKEGLEVCSDDISKNCFVLYSRTSHLVPLPRDSDKNDYNFVFRFSLIFCWWGQIKSPSQMLIYPINAETILSMAKFFCQLSLSRRSNQNFLVAEFFAPYLNQVWQVLHITNILQENKINRTNNIWYKNTIWPTISNIEVTTPRFFILFKLWILGHFLVKGKGSYFFLQKYRGKGHAYILKHRVLWICLNFIS